MSRRRASLLGIALALVASALVVFLVWRADQSAPAPRVPLSGFGEVAYRIERGDKVLSKGCALLAESEPQLQQGLMNVRSLSGHDGMVFKFPSGATTTGFYMKNTPMPLSIAWFDTRGGFVSSADMEPFRESPSYFSATPYRYAFEVPKGRLPSLGIGAGSTLVLSPGGC